LLASQRLVIQDRKLRTDARLQRRQHRGGFDCGIIRHRFAEDLVDHPLQILCPVTIIRIDLLGGQLDGLPRSGVQGSFLLRAEHELSELLPASLGELPGHPRSQVEHAVKYPSWRRRGRLLTRRSSHISASTLASKRVGVLLGHCDGCFPSDLSQCPIAAPPTLLRLSFWCGTGGDAAAFVALAQGRFLSTDST